MNDLARVLGTATSPVLVSITNQMPAMTAPSGDPAASMVPRNPYLNQDGSMTNAAIALSLLSTASAAASAFHGYKRNESVAWALWWGFCGGMFPVVVPTIAVAQGFGKRER